MKKGQIIVVAATAIVLAAATIVERLQGAEVAQEMIYQSWWFTALLAIVGIGAVVSIVQGKMWHRPALLMVHAAVPLILLGGGLTTWTGIHGEVTLQRGQPSNHFSVDGKQHTLPYSIELEQFEVVPYPGTQSPMDFVSHVVVDGERHDISMNHILRHRGYRFYQADYDSDGSSTLSVAHDPIGIGVTYCGYALLMIGIVGLMVSRKGRFRQLLKGGAVMALIVIGTGTAAATPHTLPRQTADEMGRMYVLYKGRVCPLQTLAKDFTTKLTGQATYHGLSSEQVLAGWLFYYDEWSEEPMLKIKGKEVRQLMGCEGRRAAYAGFTTPSGQHPIEEALSALSPTDPKAKNLRAADEKYNLVKMLQGGQLLKIFPIADAANSLRWAAQNDDLPPTLSDDEYLFIRRYLSLCQQLVLEGDYDALTTLFQKTRTYQEQHAAQVLPSAAQIKAERTYNALTTGRWLAMASATLGLLLFAVALIQLGRGKRQRSLSVVAISIVALLTLFQTVIFILRWVAGGHAPMAGGFDSMNLMAIALGVIGLIGSRRHPIAAPAALLTMGLCLMVAMMSGSNPPITHLMPVLASPLLTLHVSVVMCAYALFFFVMLGGIAGLAVPSKSERFWRVNTLMLYPAIALLALGIIIGAVWANISWGNYWSWDPKEVWALITLIVYALPLHFGGRCKARFFHLYCILAFVSVVITYFGVNLILGGMHAYN